MDNPDFIVCSFMENSIGLIKGAITSSRNPLEIELTYKIYLRNKEMQQTLRVIVSIHNDASF